MTSRCTGSPRPELRCGRHKWLASWTRPKPAARTASLDTTARRCGATPLAGRASSWPHRQQAQSLRRCSARGTGGGCGTAQTRAQPCESVNGQSGQRCRRNTGGVWPPAQRCMAQCGPASQGTAATRIVRGATRTAASRETALTTSWTTARRGRRYVHGYKHDRHRGDNTQRAMEISSSTAVRAPAASRPVGYTRREEWLYASCARCKQKGA